MAIKCPSFVDVKILNVYDFQFEQQGKEKYIKNNQENKTN